MAHKPGLGRRARRRRRQDASSSPIAAMARQRSTKTLIDGAHPGLRQRQAKRAPPCAGPTLKTTTTTGGAAVGSARRPNAIQRIGGSSSSSRSHNIRARASAGSSLRPAASGVNVMELIKNNSPRHFWKWARSTDPLHPYVVSEDQLSVCFHPYCSDSTVACRSVEPIKRNGNHYYWEIHVKDKVYGTSIMFGLCTRRQRMHMFDYHNLIGMDDCGWSLSHKGLIWHKGLSTQYTDHFPQNQPVTVGVLFDTLRGELSFFLNGRNLGVAFRGLNSVQEDLYPVAASTAKSTRMTLVSTYHGHTSLLELSCFSLIKSIQGKDPKELIEYLRKEDLPKQLLEYVARAANVSLATVN